ncbi:interferon-inducible GTPase 5-like [Sceloporus undulatus]|uniref:interferon-inducible GTPase 5-like n=1 Tax=Sceloporus undulatus TaxID=8520 RepID=UPI001C4B4BF8|nr:interferon-inducible GTPase 5-like [Sceloporus undulatus]XP_042295255.1 interferon-inducible GTPase 5-like [Sceloporus undulatus]
MASQQFMEFFIAWGVTIARSYVIQVFAKMKAALGELKLLDIESKLQKEMELLDNTTLHIAITGGSGVGKSSLVNALRGLTDDGEGSANTGETETTMEPQAYQHPEFSKVKLWDLPGIGTDNFKADQYLKQVDFSRYDFFIIVVGNRFSENDTKLACEIQKMKKKFYYVRSKIDESISNESKKKNFNEAETIQKIRDYCEKSLKRKGDNSAKVFLITRWDLSKYDFPCLQNALEEDLDDLKRHVLVMSMPAFSKEAIKSKENAMLDLIWKVSLLSCTIRVTPIPFLPVICDTVILVTAMTKMYKCFGLDEDSLHRLGAHVGKPVDELKSAIKNTPTGGAITTQFVVDYLHRSKVWVTVSLVESLLYFIPVLGSLAGGAGAFLTTFYMLTSFLKDVVEDAQNVLAKSQEK